MASAAASRTATRRFRRLACLLGAGVAAFTCAQSALATTPLDPQVRLSVTGAEGDVSPQSTSPAVAVNTRTGERLVAWYHSAAGTAVQGRFVGQDGLPVGDEFHISEKGASIGDPAVAYNPVANEYMLTYIRTRAARTEVVVHRLSAAGAEIGDDVVISSMRPGTGTGAQAPDIAYDQARDEYLVVWEGDDDRGALVTNEYEIYGQRITADGTQTGPDDIRISDMGTDGDATAAAYAPHVAWNAAHDEYLVTWWGDDATAPRVDNEFDVHAQRLAGDGTEVGENDRRISDAGPVVTSTTTRRTRRSPTTRSPTSTRWCGRATTTPPRWCPARRRSSCSASRTTAPRWAPMTSASRTSAPRGTSSTSPRSRRSP